MVEDPLTDKERREVAQKFVADMGLAMPALLDGVDDAVGKAYASHPDRLYLIGKDGLVAYAGDKGPMGFEPSLLREAIEDELVNIRQDAEVVHKPVQKKAPASLREVLDADGDGDLSSVEIANATEVLRKLDKNGDGKVSKSELPTKSPVIR